MKHEISVHLHTFPYLIEGWSLFRMPNPIGTAILGLQQEALKHTYECSLFPRLLTSGPTLIDWHFSASIGSAEAENTLTTLERKRQTSIATMEIKLNLTVRLQGSFECSLQYSDSRKCFWGCSIRRWNKPLHGVCCEDTWRIALLRLADILQLQLICKNRRHFVKARKKAANIHSNEGKKAESFKAALQAAFQAAWEIEWSQSTNLWRRWAAGKTQYVRGRSMGHRFRSS